MGKFINTTYSNTIDNLTSAMNEKINNPYYKYTDQKPSKVTYYSQNIEKSTLDQASGLYEAHVSSKSPIKYNKIKDFIIYGLERINTEYDAGDFGVESQPITGDAIILPKTIEPMPGDFFILNYLKEDLLFKVNGVSIDTLDTSANIYKIEYATELVDSKNEIEKQVDKNFSYIADNVGTQMKSIILDDDYKVIEKLDLLIVELITTFENLFFDSKLQTFVFNYDGWYMYDPFLIEFLKRNKILNHSEKYVFVDHATTINKTFSMDYMKTLFYALENPNEKNLLISGIATADKIDDPNSLFVTRMNEYYSIRYIDNTPYKTRFEVFNQDVLDRIKSGKRYSKGAKKEIYNLWIDYFNNKDKYIKGNMMEMLKYSEYLDNLECFYAIPIAIFIIEKYILNILNNKE